MKIIKISLLVLMLLAASVTCGVSGKINNSRAKTESTAPEMLGVDPQAIKKFIEELNSVPETDIHHVVIARKNSIIAEGDFGPFAKNEVHTLYSCSKTFTMLAIGMLVDDGKLSVDDKVIDLLPDKAPAEKSDALKAMTVKHLLTMCAGIEPSLTLWQESDDWAKSWLAQPVTRLGDFQYDSLCTFMLSSIVQRITGKTLLEFLNERFFHPLGIYEADWEESPDGINVGGWGLRLTAESMAIAGICIMHKGKWGDKQLVSEKWIEEASQAHTNYKHPDPKPTDTNQGYCYQMWRCLQPGAFRADGAYGQFIVMSSEHDLVVVITGVSHNTGKELACIWNYLIPGVNEIHAPVYDSAGQQMMRELPPPMDVSQHLRLILSIPRNDIDSIKLELGPNARSYRTMSIEFSEKDYGISTDYFCRMKIVRDDGTIVEYPFLFNDWAKRTTTQAPPYNNAVGPVDMREIKGLKGEYNTAGTCYWLSDNKLVLKIYWTNWIVCNTFTIDFHEDGTATITNDEGYPCCEPEIINATYESSAKI
ncbi:MAG: serine hydrolase [Muribaculaceae bacterium]|nr:serine hydrolase [Muribaculaceae bacterium]